MKITFLVIGKTNEKYLTQAFSEYEKRLKRYVHFTYIEIADVKNAKNMPPEVLKKKEAEKILEKVSPSDYLAILDEKGKEFTSVQFGDFLEKQMIQGTRNLTFLVGGAFGFDDMVYERTNSKISLSKMTFPHQLIRVIFAEQLYRAFTIIKGEPYHNE